MALGLFSSSLDNIARQNMEDKATKNVENMTLENCLFATAHDPENHVNIG